MLVGWDFSIWAGLAHSEKVGKEDDTKIGEINYDKFCGKVIVAKLIRNMLQKNYLGGMKGKITNKFEIPGENKTGEFPPKHFNLAGL